MRMQKFWHDTAADGTWAGYYDGKIDPKTYNFFTRRTAAAHLLSDEGKFERILDVGCGTGDYVEIADQHDSGFFGIDYAPAMIEGAIKRFPGHGKKHLFVVGVGHQLPFKDDMFDVVLGMGYIEYFADPAVAMREIRRVLKPGGLLILQGYKKDFFSWVDRWVIDPIKAVLRPIRLALGAKLGNAKPYLPPDWLDLKYNRRQLDAVVQSHGFEVEAWTYNNFHVFPAFMMLRFPQAYIGMSEWIQRRCQGLFGWLAVNYIGKYRVDKKPAGGAQ